MRITLKTLQNVRYQMDIDPAATIAQFKEQIHTELDIGDASWFKIIHHGKILKDEDTPESAGVREYEFLVVMIRRPRKTPAASASATSSTHTTPASGGPQHEAAVEQLMGMGFERPQVEQALQAAFGSVDRAVEYLLNGMPPAGAARGGGPSRSAMAGPMGPIGGPIGGPSGGAAASTASDGMDVGQILSSNPQLLESLLRQLVQTNPEIVAEMQQNPAALPTLLNSPAVRQQLAMLVGGSGGSGSLAVPAASSRGGRQGLGASGGTSLSVTAEEKSAIDALAAMANVPVATAAQAYIACDKNADLAANFLIENSGDSSRSGGGGAAPPAAAAPHTGGSEIPDAPSSNAAS